jgi:fermentation-respiration switch protein FrsA (DUF1100 family)
MSKRNRDTVRLATGVGLALGGVALAATALYTEVMTSLVARRRTVTTDVLMEIATGKPLSSPDETIQAKADALLNTPTETVAIRSREGYVLRAHWYPAADAKRIVILVHGWHGSWNMDFSLSAPFLHDNQCSLLLIEQRCHGNSGGDLISYGINERYDVLSWLEWVEANHPALPVYLCGLSMGASTVLMTAGLPIAGRVCGIIADCGYSTPKEIVKMTLQKSLGKMAAPTLAAVNANCKRREKFSLGDYTPIEAMAANTQVPCLFVHGDEDTLVPWRMSLENYYACQAPKDLLIVSGAAHGMSFAVDPDRYKKKLLDFFAAYDPPPPPPKKRGGRKAGKDGTS